MGISGFPLDKKVVQLKLVYKMKYHSNGRIQRHKAYLVTKGYTQEAGVDFNEIYAQRRWPIYQFDVKSAFLNGEILEEVSVKQPLGYEMKGEEKKVLKLKKALYGLKQAPRD